MALSGQIIQSPDTFEGLRNRWNALNTGSAFPSLFMTWEWQFSWWQSFGGDLFIVLIQDEGQDLAILPFVAEKKRLFTQLKPIGAPHSDYLGFLIRKGEEARVEDYFFGTFLSANRRLGILVFDSVNERFAHTKWKKISGFLKVFHKQSPCPYLPLPDSFAACLENLSGQTRYLIRRKTRKVEKDFTVTLGVAGTRDELNERMELFFDQHQARWTGKGRPGAFYNTVFQDFHRMVAERLFATGNVMLFYMDLDEKPAASYYLFQFNGDLLFYLSGFDPDFASYSPGTILLSRIIEDAIEKHYHEFDFMRGTAPYKFKWSDKTRINHSFWLVRTHPACLIYFMGEWVLGRMAEFLKHGLSLRTKRMIRNVLPQWVIRSFDRFFRE